MKSYSVLLYLNYTIAYIIVLHYIIRAFLHMCLFFVRLLFGHTSLTVTIYKKKNNQIWFFQFQFKTKNLKSKIIFSNLIIRIFLREIF